MGWSKRGLQHAVSAALRIPVVRQLVRNAGRSGVLPQSVWQRLPISGTIPVRLDDGLSFVYRSELMDHLGRFLFFGGATAWEPEVMRVLPALARRARGVIDVGAHTGLFTLVCLAVNPATRIVAIEPVLKNAILLQQNIGINRFSARCIMVVAACANRFGTVAFDTGPVEIPMTAAIRETEDHSTIRIPTISIDSIAEWLPSVDLIKIDVEGFEHIVLAGARETLATTRPTLVIECLPGSRIEEFTDVLDSLGYRRYRLLPDCIMSIDRINTSLNSPTNNYLLVARNDVIADLEPQMMKTSGCEQNAGGKIV